MRGNFSPARNVLCTTAPLPRFFSFVRTKAPPLPGFTCWNSTMRQTSPSTWMCMPLRNWFVETVSATGAQSRDSPASPARPSADDDELLRERRQHLRPVVAHDHEILDADAAEPRQVHPRLYGDDVPHGERAGHLRVE